MKPSCAGQAGREFPGRSQDERQEALAGPPGVIRGTCLVRDAAIPGLTP